MAVRAGKCSLLQVLTAALLAAVAALAQAAPAPPAPAPTPTVDEKARTVTVPAVAAKQGTYDVLKGAIEYALVAKGGKEYESLFVTPCTAQDLNDALLKIGLKAGRPATDDAPPRGRPVRVFVECEQSGKTVRRPIDAFLAYIKAPDKPVEPLPWTFTGSSKGFDPAAGKEVLQASVTQSLIGLHYNDSTPLVQNPRAECRESNIYRANLKELPAADSKVRIVFEYAAPKIPDGTRRVHVFVSGRVQGVGYRNFTEGVALRQKVAGFVRNLADGRVEAVVEGPAAAVQAVLDEMKRGPRAAQVEKLDVKDEPPEGDFETFAITYEGA